MENRKKNISGREYNTYKSHNTEKILIFRKKLEV